MNRRELLAAFRIAINREAETERSYVTLAAQTDDPAAQKLFRRFARDERSHRENLQKLYASLRDTVPPRE